MQRIKTKIGDLLTPSNMAAWPKVRKKLNRLLAGWTAYFGYGTVYRRIGRSTDHVYERVRHLPRAAAQDDRAWRAPVPCENLHGELGVLSPQTRASRTAAVSLA